MKPINKRAAAVLDKLTADLADPTRGEGVSARKINTAPGSFVPVSVERIGSALYSVAHYVEQNGDLVSDPEMVFWRNGEEGWHPVSITQGFLGVYREVLFFDGHVYPRRIDTRWYRDLASFARTWLRNIAAQQDLRQIRSAETIDGLEPVGVRCERDQGRDRHRARGAPEGALPIREQGGHVMREYRCTRQALYGKGTIGYDSVQCRQGYYIEAASRRAALAEMARRFPEDAQRIALDPERYEERAPFTAQDTKEIE